MYIYMYIYIWHTHIYIYTYMYLVTRENAPGVFKRFLNKRFLRHG